MTELIKTSLLEGLNKEQALAVRHSDGPLLIVAGAGTGKTTVITRRIAWLIEQGLAKPNEILALTFTEKAAGEMEERVDKLLPLGYHDLWVSTFHSFAQRILEAHALDIGLPVNFRLMTTTELWMLVRQNFDRFELDYYRPLGNPSRFIHSFIRHFSRAKDELVSPEEYLKYAKDLELDQDSDIGLSGEERSAEIKRLSEVASAYATYQKLLAETGALDFGDLITYTYQLFKNRPNILSRYQKQFKYLLVDEFQDTNFAQYELVKLLAAPNNNIAVVGDDDQSIYKFRGASVSNILKFKETFPKADQITLTQNYRSRQNLLDLSYKFIQANNPDRLEVKLGISKKLIAERKGEGTVKCRQYQDYHAEAVGVLENMVKLHLKDPENTTWNDFAVLVRANDTAEAFIDAFDRAGIPFLQVSRKGLYKKPVIIDVIAYLRTLINPHGAQWFYRVLNMSHFGFSHADLTLLLDFANRKTHSLYEALQNPALIMSLSESGQKSARKLLELITKHSTLAREKPINELFITIIKDLGLAEVTEDPGEFTTRTNYLNQFNHKVQDFAASNHHRNLRDFVEQLDMEQAAGEEGSLEIDTDIGPEAAKIITVHSAKGLEFKHVFVAGLADKKFPAIGRGEPIELPDKLIKDILPAGDFHLQEERRLFYVATTRARDSLHFSYAQDYGGSTVRKPSKFLTELGLTDMAQEQPTGQVEFKSKKKSGTSYRVPKSFSFSSISDFRKCPYEYKHRYILGVPEPGKATFSFGRTIHTTLEQYLKHFVHNNAQNDLFGATPVKPELPAFDRLVELYKQNWIDDWYEDKKQKEDYRKVGREILKNLYDYFTEHPPKPKYIEKKFKLGINGYVFTGKIDRADQLNGGLLIVDYKTGSGKDRPIAKVDREQLLIYQWAAEEFLGEKVENLEYWFLRDGVDVKSFKGTAKQVEEVKQGIRDTIEKIVDAVKNDSFEKYHHKHQDCKYS